LLELLGEWFQVVWKAQTSFVTKIA
jgi:hypothetical protein